MSSSSQIISKIESEAISPSKKCTITLESGNNQVNLTIPKKSNHIRNSSLSSTNQALQLMTSGYNQQQNQNESVVSVAYKKDSNNLSQNYSTTLSKSGTISKKPVYVYVDHKYEEKIYDKLVKTTPIPVAILNGKQSAKSVELEHVQAKTDYISRPYSATSHKITRPNKLEDLLNNSCSANTGTAISVADLTPNSVKTSLSSTFQTLSSTLTRNSTHLNTNAYASSSITGSDSIGSSRVSSNNSSSNLNNICKSEESQYQLLSFEDRMKYQNYLANVNRSSQIISSNSINNSWSSNFKVTNPKRTTPIFKSDSVNQQKPNFDNTILRNSLIRPKELESKHETSV
jgi:hypothetical protein